MAEVISIAAGRRRFAPRVAERAQRNLDWNASEEERQAEEREQKSRGLRARWIPDLETWPQSFQRRLRARVMRETSPEGLEAVWSRERAEEWAERRAGEPNPTWRFFTCFEEQIRRELGDLRGSIYRFRTARGPKAREKARAELERCKADVCEALWSWGVRKVDREALTPWALAEIDERTAAERRLIDYLPEAIEDAERRLADGRCRSGPRKGKPLAESYRRQMESQIRCGQRRLEASRLKLAGLEAEPDPLRAVGVYPCRASRVIS